MKIGIFDSGLGGLSVARGLIQRLPQYDYLYLGDTARVPYGNRSQEKVYQFTEEAVEYLFEKDCQIIIIACNTASADALRKIQREYLPLHFPERKVLGVLIPAAEEAVLQSKNKKIGVLATSGTVHSEKFVREIQNILPDAIVTQNAAPLLVPLVENNGFQWVPDIVAFYVKPLIEAQIDTLILGCTHYPFVKKDIKNFTGSNITLISQDEIIPEKFSQYLERHSEIESLLSKNETRSFMVTDVTPGIEKLAIKLFGEEIVLEKVDLENDKEL